jgi:hypothetical protein
MTPDPVLAKASAAGFLHQRELEKILSSGILWSPSWSDDELD